MILVSIKFGHHSYRAFFLLILQAIDFFPIVFVPRIYTRKPGNPESQIVPCIHIPLRNFGFFQFNFPPLSHPPPTHRTGASGRFTRCCGGTGSRRTTSLPTPHSATGGPTRRPAPTGGHGSSKPCRDTLGEGGGSPVPTLLRPSTPIPA